jgi:hypothetical protein
MFLYPRSSPPSAFSARIVQAFQYREGVFRTTLKEPIAADVTKPASVLINKKLQWAMFGLVWTLDRPSTLSGSFWSDLKHFLTEWRACQFESGLNNYLSSGVPQQDRRCSSCHAHLRSSDVLRHYSEFCPFFEMYLIYVLIRELDLQSSSRLYLSLWVLFLFLKIKISKRVLGRYAGLLHYTTKFSLILVLRPHKYMFINSETHYTVILLVLVFMVSCNLHFANFPSQLFTFRRISLLA